MKNHRDPGDIFNVSLVRPSERQEQTKPGNTDPLPGSHRDGRRCSVRRIEIKRVLSHALL
jgi:hypothetical protein